MSETHLFIRVNLCNLPAGRLVCGKIRSRYFNAFNLQLESNNSNLKDKTIIEKELTKNTELEKLKSHL